MRFILRDDVAYIEDDEGVVVVSADANTTAKAYFSGSGADPGILPPAVRWISSDNQSVIMERPPQRVELAYKDTTYDVPLPWTVWGIRFSKNLQVDSSFLFARPFPISTPEDELFVLPLPNMDTDCSVAMPSIDGLDIGSKLLPMIQAYLSRPFTGAFKEMLNSKELVPTEWQPHIEEGIEKYFTFLSGMSLEEIVFADLQVASIRNFNELSTLLDVKETKSEQTTLEYLQSIVEQAADL